MIVVPRALSFTELAKKKYKLYRLTGAWYDFLGEVEDRGTWFIYGESGSGKTSFLLQLMKQMSQFGTVLLNSVEMGDSYTMHQAEQRGKMEDVRRKCLLVNEEVAILSTRLARPKSPRIIFIDSFQFWDINFKSYQALVKRFPDKLFIFISHVDGRQPEGRPARSVMKVADLKIWVEGFVAYSKGRYGAGNSYTIYEKGAQEYHNSKLNKEA